MYTTNVNIPFSGQFIGRRSGVIEGSPFIGPAKLELFLVLRAPHMKFVGKNLMVKFTSKSERISLCCPLEARYVFIVS
jgi:hypothetical protein